MKNIIIVIILILSSLSCSNTRNKEHAQEFNKKSIQFNQKQQYDSALVYMNSAINLDPENYLFQINKANVLLETKQFDQVIRTYEKALELNTKANVRLLLGELYAKKMDVEKSKMYFNDNIEFLNQQISTTTDQDVLNTLKVELIITKMQLGQERNGKQLINALKKEFPDDEFINLTIDSYEDFMNNLYKDF